MLPDEVRNGVRYLATGIVMQCNVGWGVVLDSNCPNIESTVKIRWCACAWWNWNGMKQQGQCCKSKGGRVVCSHS